MADQENNQAANEAQQAGFEFQIQRIYIKDVSFEAPNLPQIFQQDWEPKLHFEMNTETNDLSENLYEVVLNVTLQSKLESTDTVAFLCEVKQAGVFFIKGIQDMNLAHCLAAQCPTILYPYARELISSLVARGTFPQLNLQPVNFDQLFIDFLRQQEQQSSANQ